MTVRNEERHLAQAVASVLGQDYPGGLEIVLAVGPSDDATADIAAGLAALDRRVTVVPNPTGGIPVGSNAAIRASRYPVIARVDGHAQLPPGYLKLAVQTLADTGADNVGGIMAACGHTPFERAVAWAMTSPAGVGSSRFHTGGRAGPVDSVYLGVYRRASIELAGGYDESYLRAEDWELNHRIRAAGGLVWFQPALRVTYRPRRSLRTLAAQYCHYGRWRRVVARQHPGTMSLRYLAPPAAVVTIGAGVAIGVVGTVAHLAGPWPALGWLALGFAIPALYLAGLFCAMASSGLTGRALAWLPLVLATMHLAWGAGFLTSPRSLRRAAPHPWPHDIAASPRSRGRVGK